MGTIRKGAVWTTAVALGAALAEMACAVAWASEPEAARPCFDAEVSGRIVRQTPTPIPSCEGCMVVSWPWIVDLDVEDVLQGMAPRGRLKVLSIQHTYRAGDSWLLRRNSQGGFNIAQFDSDVQPALCGRGEPPAKPYITADPKGLRELEAAGRRAFGRSP